MIVVSGSMEPQLYRGDTIIVHNTTWSDIRVGEIVVFELPKRNVPIVHRVQSITKSASGKLLYVTKGDNNPVDDRFLYQQAGLERIGREHIIGRECGIIRMITYPLVWWNELLEYFGIVYIFRVVVVSILVLCALMKDAISCLHCN